MTIDTPYHRFQSLKILAYSDRLRSIADGGEPYPLDWHIYPSNICNHKCTWCMFRQNGEQFNFRVTLPRDVLLRAVDDAAESGAVLIHFSGGGEPLINKHTLEAMRRAQDHAKERPRSLPLKIALSTNGRLLTPEVASQVDYIRVSLNAGTPEQHHATNHGGDPHDTGDWRIILQNIAAAIPHKRQDLGLGFVVDYENYLDIYPFCEVAASLGVDFVHIRPGFYYEDDKDKMTRAVMPAAVAECNRARAAFGAKLPIYAITEKFDGYWTPKSYQQCLAVWTGTTLRATGDFAVCQDRTDLTFGTEPSYKAGASFADVWHSDQRRRVVDTIHAGGELDRCPRCVWNGRNNLIQDVFIRDEMRLALV